MQRVILILLALIGLLTFDQALERGKVRIVLAHSQKAVLVGHGWGGNASSMKPLADYVRSLGIIAQTFDLPGHGKAPGDTSLLVCNDYVEGIVAAYDALVQNPNVDPSGISVVGTSLSANLFAQVLAQRHVEVYVGNAPANYTDDMCAHPLDQLIGDEARHNELIAWRKTRLLPADYPAPLRALQSFRGKSVIVRNELDETVPAATTDNYAKAAGVGVVVIVGVGHALERPHEAGNDFGQIQLAKIVVTAVLGNQFASR
jgi:pimeloyl-ACP methyl ester carboxylesterase